MSTIWLEFPPNRLAVIKAAYLEQNIRRPGETQNEKIQDDPLIDITGTRMLIGSSRLDATKANNLKIGHSPWLIIHTEWPSDWVYPD